MGQPQLNQSVWRALSPRTRSALHPRSAWMGEVLQIPNTLKATVGTVIGGVEGKEAPRRPPSLLARLTGYGVAGSGADRYRAPVPEGKGELNGTGMVSESPLVHCKSRRMTRRGIPLATTSVVPGTESQPGRTSPWFPRTPWSGPSDPQGRQDALRRRGPQWRRHRRSPPRVVVPSRLVGDDCRNPRIVERGALRCSCGSEETSYVSPLASSSDSDGDAA